MGRKGEPHHRGPRAVLNDGTGWYPPCFKDSDEFNHWRLLLRASGESMRVGYCIDCTPEYKMQMMCEGRCKHPETQFVVLRNSKDPDQVEMVGVSSASVYWARVERGHAVIDGAEYGKNKQPS